MTTNAYYRGKTSQGTWVSGGAVEINGQYYIYPHSWGDLEDIDFGRSFVKVVNDTVTQWTGRCDKSGTRIFDKDVVLDDGDYLLVSWLKRSDQWWCKGVIGCSLREVICGTVVGNWLDTPELLPQ